METTKNLDLKKSTLTTVKTDKIEKTITEYANNFEILDREVGDSISDVDSLKTGEFYHQGKKMWNDNPQVGDFVGWVNTRGGIYAPQWKPLQNYNIDSLISASPDNGNVYKCVSAGRSVKETPVFPTSEESEFYDASGTYWREEYNYDVDDVIFPTNGSKVFYYICETAGLSNSEEPVWDDVTSGTTTIDGTVVWRKEKTVKWKQIDTFCNFRPFGKIE